jgi:hypothetical protein
MAFKHLLSWKLNALTSRPNIIDFVQYTKFTKFKNYSLGLGFYKKMLCLRRNKIIIKKKQHLYRNCNVFFRVVIYFFFFFCVCESGE